MGIDTIAEHERLIEAMMDPRAWTGGGDRRQRIDTHISTVVLAGDLAFKIKKPLDLGFLDFLDLEARELACAEEIRLNRRLAPEIYLGVSRVTGSPDRPVVDGDGATIDWAVRMRRFDPDAILANRIDAIDATLIDRLAEQVAAFHLSIERSPTDTPGGSETACAPMRQNFEQILQFAPSAGRGLGRLHSWTEAACRRLGALMDERHAMGFTRECHGDLHLGNIALIDGRPVVFDAIEFNPAFRWIDVINDIAFLVMDLQQHGLVPLSRRFLNRYLEITGDYEALGVLGLYAVYRSLVRAKIAAIRGSQADLPEVERTAVDGERDAYMRLADSLSSLTAARGGILLMHGVSGSGKSVIARRLSEELPAVVIRSDIERKRLLGVSSDADAAAQGGYTPEITEQTYERLAHLAAVVARAGYVAIVDATFLERDRRDRFAELARSLQVPLAILTCDAPPGVLAARIGRRSRQSDNVSDADLAVLERQLASREPVSDNEADRTWQSDPDHALDLKEVVEYFSDAGRADTH